MRKRIIYIVLWAFVAVILQGCQRTELIETYEEVKEKTQQAVPLSFEPYTATSIEASADTRADVSYLTAVDNNGGGRRNYYNSIPSFGAQQGTNSAYSKAAFGYDYDTRLNYRFGRTAYNSYIVGVYGFAHVCFTWSEAKNTAVANLMTNQPLLRLPNNPNGYKYDNYYKGGYANFVPNNSHWDYEPKKYWPNDKYANVTFITYYPFQDYNGLPYYRDGSSSHENADFTLNGTTYKDYNDPNTPYQDADLTFIEPPLADATGPSAYTFTFRQQNDVQKHIDFLLGIKELDERPPGNQVTLNLNHTLCAVQFSFDNIGTNYVGQWKKINDAAQEVPDEIKIQVNKIGFEGLYTKGDVYPYKDGDAVKIQWDNLRNYDADDITNYGSDKEAYMVEFEDNSGEGAVDKYPFILARIDDRPTFTYTKTAESWTYQNQTTANIYTKETAGNNRLYGQNSRGFRYLLLVVPQTVNDNDNAKLVVDYDLSYRMGDDWVIYKNTISKVKLDDNLKDKNKGQLFIAGRMLVFNVRFTPIGIQADAEVVEWPGDEELEVEGEIDG